jgi:polypeptide N-acetylgalactosaminyltransferase
MGRGREEPLGMYPCADNKTHPQDTQFFTLRYYRDIAIVRSTNCFDSSGSTPRRNIVTYACHHGQGNQYFRYDLETKRLYHGVKRNNFCVDMEPKNKTVFVTACDENSQTQLWKWGFVNKTNLNNWMTYGTKIEDKQELVDLSKVYDFN